MNEILASIVVPFYNAAATLERCAVALLRQSLEPNKLELIFVDDGSTDVGRRILESHPQIKVLTQMNLGPAAARNIGIKHATGKWILFTDADCEPEPDWAEKLMTCLADEQVSGVKGVYCTEQKDLTARFVQLEYEEKYRYMTKFKNIDFIDTYCAGYRKSALERHGFDESYPFPSVEDQELSFRLAAQGHLLKFCPNARVKHWHVASARGYLSKKFKIGFWKAKLLLKHHGQFKGDTHTPFSLKLQLLLVPSVILSWLLYILVVPLESFLILPMALSAMFLLSNFGLLKSALQQDICLLLLVPFYSGLRALGLGAGLIYGFIHFFRESTNQT